MQWLLGENECFLTMFVRVLREDSMCKKSTETQVLCHISDLRIVHTWESSQGGSDRAVNHTFQHTKAHRGITREGSELNGKSDHSIFVKYKSYDPSA